MMMATATYQVETVQSSEQSSIILLGSSNLPSPYFHRTPEELPASQSTHNNRNMQLPPVPNYQGMAMNHLPMPLVPPNTPQPAHIIPYPLASNPPTCNNRAIVTRQPRPPPLAQKHSKPSHVPRTCQPQLIATISAGFTKGDYLIREDRGCNLYFDFFEEAYNFACQKGYSRMDKLEEEEYMDIIQRAHRSVPGGCRYNTGRLLMVLRKKLVPVRIMPSEVDEESEEPLGPVMDEERSASYSNNSTTQDDEDESNIRKKKMEKKLLLARSTNTLPTDSESSAYSSSASTSCVDSWE